MEVITVVGLQRGLPFVYRHTELCSNTRLCLTEDPRSKYLLVDLTQTEATRTTYSEAMQQSLSRLAIDNAVIQRLAVGSLFHLLGQHDAYNTKAGAAVIQQCLGSASSVRPILLQWSLH